ncbi:hypothetical protein ASPSYDRAFT_52382 [Aspergillus sydowii CBS 593.65]|uniref:Uncharacterized protein n=1 Tax=Aspergillus sydowii CBS 593.65 TaxID=1036612 RepID=A0A1L9SYD3_9EURO|nr:uncharacterized protein ASPSYDRAFT_52382 [Aspergillus sydowii CBS 593.65]OJJ52147.1 hypothetical protein ASPSYDRAFT_52382 [Aspergillus sydowii CBS 593.65]
MAALLCHGISGMTLIVFPSPGIQSGMAEQKAHGVVMTSACRPEKGSSTEIINCIHIDGRVL